MSLPYAPHALSCSQVWTSLPTGEMLSEAAARTVRPPLNPDSPAVVAVTAAGLDARLLYDYR